MSRLIYFYARGAIQAADAFRSLADRLVAHAISMTLREVKVDSQLQQKYPH